MPVFTGSGIRDIIVGMPIYEYTCTACGKEYELLVRSAQVPPACPHCASPKAKKRFSTFGVATGVAPANSCGMPQSSAPRFEGDCGASWCKPDGGCAE